MGKQVLSIRMPHLVLAAAGVVYPGCGPSRGPEPPLPRERATWHGHQEAVVSVAFAPDGRTLASGDHSGNVKLWDVGAGRERASAWHDSNPIRSLAFSPDSQALASAATNRTVKLWDVVTGREQAALEGPAPGIF